MDWWFLADSNSVSAGLPTSVSAGALAARSLTTGPADIALTLDIAGTPALLRARSARIEATIDGTPAPDVPAPPPAALATGLTVFQVMTASGANQGLCGNVTVESLAQVPVPAAFASGGSFACGACSGSHVYTACTGGSVSSTCNSLLDLLVGGCVVVNCVVVAVNPLQPDVAANGTLAPLTLGAGSNKVLQQTAGDLDAYSAWLKLDANRAHLTGQACQLSSQCQAGTTCVGGTCE
jgi:hypothetical protein